MNELKEKLTLLIKEACRQLAAIANNEEYDGKCHIHIPPKDEEQRISEQELKYVFLELFVKCDDMQGYTYSVETPTENKYRFSEKGENEKKEKVTPECGTGRRANIDVVIFKGDDRVAMIEFKSGNPDEHSHAKDFVKLKEEPGNGLLRFFVELYSSSDKGTLKSIHKKLHFNPCGKIDENTMFIGFSLNHKNSGCGFIVDTGEKNGDKESQFIPYANRAK